MNFCIAFLLCLNPFSSVFAQEKREAPALVQQSQDQNKQVRITALIEALKDRDDQVRSNAAFALGQIGVEARQAAPALGELLKDQNAWARGNAAFALGRIGEAKSYLPSLIELLKDQNENVRSSWFAPTPLTRSPKSA